MQIVERNFEFYDCSIWKDRTMTASVKKEGNLIKLKHSFMSFHHEWWAAGVEVKRIFGINKNKFFKSSAAGSALISAPARGLTLPLLVHSPKQVKTKYDEYFLIFNPIWHSKNHRNRESVPREFQPTSPVVLSSSIVQNLLHSSFHFRVRRVNREKIFKSLWLHWWKLFFFSFIL